MRAIDYLLADDHLIPASAEAFFPETVHRLPSGYVAYEPPSEAPLVGPLPATTNGYVTFGSFNNPAKLTREVVCLWSRIMRQIPEARLVLKYHGLDDPGTRHRMEQLFVDCELSPTRLKLQGWSSYEDFLAAHNQIDVALDPFPFAGGATTCNALWMGVPVITWPGETFASRKGLSYLSRVGLKETIASDAQEYADIAVGLASDLDRLTRLRADLRSRMAASLLCDGSQLAENLLAFLRSAWERWCRTTGEAP